MQPVSPLWYERSMTAIHEGARGGHSARDLAAMSRRELMDVLRAGHPIDPHDLDDTEYKGVSLGLPAFVERLTWKTFKKVFHRDAGTGHLRGWNVRIEQNNPDAYTPKLTNGQPITFGHYRVVPLEGYRMPQPCDHGLMLDYGLGGNAPWDFISRVRDPIVAVNPGDSRLLLGWSYLDLGALRFGTPSFFSLERDIPLTHRVDPARPS
jgi:hypothetical protein